MLGVLPPEETKSSPLVLLQARQIQDPMWQQGRFLTCVQIGVVCLLLNRVKLFHTWGGRGPERLFWSSASVFCLSPLLEQPPSITPLLHVKEDDFRPVMSESLNSN